ncbi:MAG TPA: hypothetical protein EYG97_04480 [Arcobacter sp.]|nr:hypothetical protein [Arcobacter sp.]HIP56262.1 hypothetical protein [Arcobacter sp.]
MLKIIFSLLFITNFAFSSQIIISTKIISKIISAIHSDAKIWIDNKEDYLNIIDIEKLNIVSNCYIADVFITKGDVSLPSNCKNKPTLVFDYDLLYTNKNSVSAFFWKKGRPHIVFVKERLDKFNITIPSKYNSYLIEKL